MVTYLKDGYYVWRGVDQEFDATPIANTLRSNKTKAALGEAKQETGAKRARKANFGQDSDEEAPVRDMRRRTERQKHPYAIDKVEAAHIKKGKKPSEQFLKKELKRKREGHTATSHKRRSTSTAGSSLTPRASSASPSSMTSISSAAAQHNDVATTIVRTRFMEFSPNASTVVRFPTAPGELFSSIERKWKSVLKGRAVSHCTISFPWLSDDAKLLLFRDDDDNATLTTMQREVHRAPTWEETGDCSINVEFTAEDTVAADDA